MRARNGFTLVEMLVSMALTLFVMVILSQAFIAALDTFSGLKSIGDMDEGLRTVANNLRADLQREQLAGRRLSQIGAAPVQSGFLLVAQGLPLPGAVNELDWENKTNSVPNDTASALDFRRTASHVLHFSMKSRGKRSEDFFPAYVPPGSPLFGQMINPTYQGQYTPFSSTDTITSQWAEVAYFMQQQGTTDTPNQVSASGTPLFKLYRSQFLVVEQAGLTGPVGTHDHVSYMKPELTTGTLNFHTPAELAQGIDVNLTKLDGNIGTATATTAATHGFKPGDRVRMKGAATPAFNGIFNILTTPKATEFTYSCSASGTDASANIKATRLPFRRFNPLAPDTTGATLLLSNVVSFSVHVFRTPNSVVDLGVNAAGNPITASSAPTRYPAIFDTSGADSPFARLGTVPSLNFTDNAPGAATSLAPTSIYGLQISIRVWDVKTRGSRQITIIQDL